MARRGLGKGLGVFFSEDAAEKQPVKQEQEKTPQKKNLPDTGNGKTEHRPEKAGSEKVIEKVIEKPVEQKLKLSLIEPNQSQPRKKFDEEGLKELADSIKTYGVLQPLIVQKKKDHYEIIAGERRWRAAKMAGITEVPVLIREYDRQQSMEVALIENVQRADLNPIEEAQAYQRLIQEFHLTQEEIAARVSKNRATITNSMRLLKLDERVQEMLSDGRISSGHARAILGVENGEQQFQLANKIVQDGIKCPGCGKTCKKDEPPGKEKEGRKGPRYSADLQAAGGKIKIDHGYEGDDQPKRPE